MKFSTKPFQIEAVQFLGDNWEEVHEFAKTDTEKIYAGFTRIADDTEEYTAAVYNALHDTWVKVKRNQWIIKDQKGAVYPCDPDIFEEKYESVG